MLHAWKHSTERAAHRVVIPSNFKQHERVRRQSVRYRGSGGASAAGAAPTCYNRVGPGRKGGVSAEPKFAMTHLYDTFVACNTGIQHVVVIFFPPIFR